MRTFFSVFLLSAAATFVLTPWVRRLAFRLNAVDLPGGRKIHAEPIPRLGGVGVFAGFCFPWTGLYLIDNRVAQIFQNFEKLFAALIAGAAAMVALGIYDDCRGLSARTKLVVQLAIATALVAAGYKAPVLSNPFGASIELGWFAWPLSIVWIVGITNAINLLDGIDGLVSGVTACIALSLAVINVMQGNVIVALLTLSLAGACLGFLPYNFSPARIFLGDSGSLLLGFSLACVGTLSFFKGTTATLVLAPLILFALPVYDTLTVMFGRTRRGVSIFQADKSHIHHRLLELGLNQKQVAYFLYTLTGALAGAAVCLNVNQTANSVLVLMASVSVLFGLLWITWRFRNARRGKEP